MSNRLIALLLLQMITEVFAADSAIKDFAAATRSSYEICRGHAIIGNAEVRQCLTREGPGVQSKYEAAEKVSAKSKPVVGLIRDLYATWRAEFDELPAQTSELRSAYEKRTGDGMSAINRRATRLELEK